MTAAEKYERVRVSKSIGRAGESDKKKMVKTSEQRRWTRYNVTLDVNVTAGVNGQQCQLSGQVGDVSKGGLRLFVPRKFEPGTSLTLEFLLPYSSSELILRGVVRNRSEFTHGIEFINPTVQQQSIIERTCDVFALLR